MRKIGGNVKQSKLRKIAQYYKPVKGIFFADLLFATLGAVTTILIPLLVRYITNDVIYWENSKILGGIITVVLIMLALLAIEMYCNYFMAFYGHVMGTKIEYTMRNEIFAHYQTMDFTFFDNQKVGQLMSRVTGDLFEISELLHHGPEELLICFIKLVGTFAVLLFINWQLALVAFVPIPFMIIYAAYYNRKMKSAFGKNRARIAEINASMEDSLSGIRVVKSFAGEEHELEKFKNDNRRFVSSKKNSYRYMANYNTVLLGMTTFIMIAVSGVGAGLYAFGRIQVSDLLVFLLYISNFTEPIKKLVSVTELFQTGFSGYNRFLEMTNVRPHIEDAPDAQDISDVKGDIKFSHVSFSYETGDEVFGDLNLSVPAGDYVALVGLSGVGKSTLCSLIPRFYDVSAGSISIDGKDVRQIRLQSLRRNIGIVQQDIYLFSGTVLENISYGCPEASFEQVVAAAKSANAHDFIMALPQGYNTDIGQRGVKLSGGQKQRLSIARVFLKNPAILIFDEATSSLDNESEKLVQDSLETLAAGRTTIVIAHRLSTIHNAKRILVLTQNGIAEEGTHRQLMEKGGVYAALYMAAEL